MTLNQLTYNIKNNILCITGILSTSVIIPFSFTIPNLLSVFQFLGNPEWHSGNLCIMNNSNICKYSFLYNFMILWVCFLPCNCRNSSGSWRHKQGKLHVMWTLTSMWGCVHAFEIMVSLPQLLLFSIRESFQAAPYFCVSKE